MLEKEGITQPEEEIIETVVEEVKVIEKEPEIDNSSWKTRSLSMDEEFQMISIKNTIAILPPNLMVDGKHTKENISAIVGFKITDEQWEKAYDS